jgi:alginate O-acetyltransferase complex protein AlgI
VELVHIAVFIALAVPYYLVSSRNRPWLLFCASLIIIYWLQPQLSIRWLDYILPSLSICLVIAAWWLSRGPLQFPQRQDWTALGIAIIIILGLTLSRYISIPITFTSRPPDTISVTILISVFMILLGILGWKTNSYKLTIAIILLIALFVVTRSDSLSEIVSGVLRGFTNQDVTIASAQDLQWIGFSYVAFRLIHTFRDRQLGLLPNVSLRDYVTYALFFPTYTAGPIDRAERFVEDLRITPAFDADRLSQAGLRISQGLFKKFVIADSLAIFSMSGESIALAKDTTALWIMLYAFAFRLYFDFSGYSDIAIGIGLLFGIKLPENFSNPYLKSSVTTFWQSWHMTLSTWIRTYVYSPLSRTLIKRDQYSLLLIFVFCTLTTMVMMGLWHGITIPFFIWGIWHGTGLIVHKVWSDRTRQWYRQLKDHRFFYRIWQFAGIFLTFHFVLLGWVWFAIPDWKLASQVFLHLLGQ